MIRYNHLKSIKCSFYYETIGRLFNDVYYGFEELTIVEKIWAIIIEVVAVVTVFTCADEDELMSQIIDNNKRLTALKAYAMTA